MKERVTPDRLIEVMTNRHKQLIKNEEVPKLIENFLEEFSQVGEEIKKQDPEDFITLYEYRKEWPFTAEINLLGEGVELEYVTKYGTVAVSLTNKSGERYMVDILKIQDEKLVSTFKDEAVQPVDILNHFKGTDVYKRLVFLTEIN